MATIKTSYKEHEPLADNFPDDVAWIAEHRLDLYEQYGDSVILVYRQEVIGVGTSITEAVADAEERMRDREGILSPIIKYLSNPYRLGLYRKKKVSE